MSAAPSLQAWLAVVVVALLLAGCAGGGRWAGAEAGAQVSDSRLRVTFHLHCFSGVPAAGQARLEYWNEGIARGNPDPDCVSRTPLLPPVALRAVVRTQDPESAVEQLRLQVEPSALAAIRLALDNHQRQLVAIAVQGRLVSVVFVLGTVPDGGIPLFIADREAASALESDLLILLGHAR